MSTTRFGFTIPGLTEPPNGPTNFQTFADSAIRAMSAGLQEGVIDAGSFAVTQKSGGANMSVDVAQNIGSGAYVQVDTITGLALAYLPPAGALVNVAIGANASGNPRIDRVVVN